MLQLPSQLDPKNAKSKPISDHLEDDAACRKLLSAVVIAAKDVDPLIANNVAEFDGSTLEKIEAILKQIKGEIEAIKKLQIAADKLQTYALKLSKVETSKAAGLAALRGLQKLQVIIDGMMTNLQNAAEHFGAQRTGFKTLNTLTLDDLLKNPKALKHFQKFAIADSSNDELAYVQRYARDPVPTTLTIAEARYAELVEVNISDAINKKLRSALAFFRDDLELSESGDLRAQLRGFTEEDLGGDPNEMWSDWQTIWTAGYHATFRLVQSNTYPRFFQSKFAQDLAAELSL